MLAKMEIVEISDSSIKNIMKRPPKISDSGKKHVGRKHASRGIVICCLKLKITKTIQVQAKPDIQMNSMATFGKS